ncbi:putative MYND-type zinc finger protein samB [Seiridium cardinale]
MATSQKPQSFTDRKYFLPFEDCPAEYDWFEHYTVEAGPGEPVPKGTRRKSQHWCLLGEIVQAENFLRPRLVCKDRKGDKFVVAFYPEDQSDMPRILNKFRKGYTIAIFYPVQHEFLDMSSGIRVEDTDQTMIIPLSLRDVLQMNEDVIAHATVPDGKRKCHGCGEMKEKLNKSVR